ncbi:MAG: tRNA lysidine(34) synthetase TilS, partial [Clostridia bacterium]|nr:tRNA lysidine(34) synthetase TilS [Clostridia bacterium]
LKDKPNNTVVDLPFGCRALKMNTDLCFSLKEPAEFAPVPFTEDAVIRYEGDKFSFVRGAEMKRGVTLDPTKIPEGAVIRTRKDGDTFRRVNGKNKLLGDFLNDKKLKAFEKEKLLVLADGNTVLAILGVETAEAVKAEPEGPFLHIVKEKE